MVEEESKLLELGLHYCKMPEWLKNKTIANLS